MLQQNASLLQYFYNSTHMKSKTELIVFGNTIEENTLGVIKWNIYWVDRTLNPSDWLKCLLRGVAAHCLTHVHVIDVFVTGFLISFISFQDGVTIPAFQVSSQIFLLAFLGMVRSAKCLFLWRFCGHANNIKSIEKY